MKIFKLREKIIVGLIALVLMGSYFYNANAYIYNPTSGGGSGGGTIGSIVTGGTAGSVLFVDPSGNLGQDNSGFYYDSVNHRLGLQTTAPTHTLTLGSTSTGIAYYNTTDQTTNFERVLSSWVSNVYTIATSAGGTGTNRAIQLVGNNTTLTIGGSDPSSAGVNIQRPGTGANSLLSVGSTTGGSLNSSSSSQAGIVIDPTILQTGTAGYRGLWITPFESSTGSGSKFLIDAGTNSAQQASGTHTSKFSVDDAGNVVLSGSISVTSSGNTFGSGATGTAAVNISGVVSTAVASSTQGRLFSVDAGTLTRSADTGTIAQSATSSFGIPTLAAGAATTYTNASTLYIDGAPLAGTNATITNAAALYVNSGVILAAGGVASGFPNTTSNFNLQGTTTMGTTGTVPLSTQSINYRSLFNAQTTQVLTVNDSYASMMIGANAITTAASGTHNVVANLAVVAPVITIGTATVTNAASLYVDAAPTGATNNYALLVNSGISSFVGGIGTRTGGVIDNGTFFTTNSGGISSSTVPANLFAGATSIAYRAGFSNNSGASALTLNQSYANVIVGSSPFTTFTSGTHALLANMVVNPIGTVSSGGATVTQTATQYINGSGTGGTQNYSLLVNGGASLLSGFGTAIQALTSTTNTVTVSQHTILCDATTGAQTDTLPTAASAYNTLTGEGQIFIFTKIDSGANACTLKGNGAENINGSNTKANTTQYNSFQVQSNGTQWFVE